jgi:uncharacterized membrane protein
MSRWLFFWRKLTRRLWWRAGLYAALGVFTALAAVFLRPWVPDVMAERLGGESVEEILAVLASSLLAVATFSLGAMVTAYTSVSSSATPRAAGLVTGDDAVQKALATFVGAFLYAIVGLTAINAQYYDPEGRAIIFVVSLFVVGLVAYRLLAWVDRLSNLARLSHTIEQIETRATEALQHRLTQPRLGGGEGELPDGRAVRAPATGYVQNVDPKRLQACAEAIEGRIQILAQPGDLVRKGDALARLQGEADEKQTERICSAFVIGDNRSYDQDPRYGAVVLGEVTARALSPGVNDPGTAVAVMAAALRVAEVWAEGCDKPLKADCDRLLGPALAAEDLMDDLFGPPMRYGDADLMVAIRLQKTLRALARDPGSVGRAAAALADQALARSLRALDEADDRARLQEAAGEA